MRQFVKCQWPNSKRAYTYHFDGEPALAVGERVLVEAPRGEGKVPVTVTEIGVPKADAPVSQAKPLDSLFGLDAEGGKPAILPGRSNPFD
jgi:hypothetical protein